MNTDRISLFTHHSSLITLALSILLCLALPLLANAAPLATIPDRRFGAIDTFDNPGAAAQLGAGWTRVRFAWATLQPNNDGEWNNTFFTDEQLATELAAGRELVGLIVNTPPWALEDGNKPGVPNGLYTRDDDPNNLWAAFLRKIVSRYAGRIDHWIVWNEPDIWDPSYPGRTWGGDVKDFYQLLRVAYNVIKTTNPNATVHLSAFTYYWDVNYGRTPFFSRLLDEMIQDPSAASHNDYFDVASANLYFRTDNVYDLIAWHHQQMRDRGFDKPIWLTETNAAPSSDPAWPVANPTFNITLDEQSNFMIQSFAMALAAGASRIAVYKLADVPADHAANPEPFGLVRQDGSRRPAFAAFQVAANYLSGFTQASLDHRDGSYALVTVKRGEAFTSIAWTRQPSPITINVPAHAARAIVVDALGRQQSISSHEGQYTLELAGATCPGGCIIGGAPKLIVEGSPGVSIASVGPQPAANTQITTTIESTPSISGTVEATSKPATTATSTSTPTAAPITAPTIAQTSTSTSTPASTSTPEPTFTPTVMPASTLRPTRTPTATPPALPIINVPRSANPMLITLAIVIGTLIVSYVFVRIRKPNDE
jgi:hypothetical protein